MLKSVFNTFQKIIPFGRLIEVLSSFENSFKCWVWTLGNGSSFGRLSFIECLHMASAKLAVMGATRMFTPDPCLQIYAEQTSNTTPHS